MIERLKKVDGGFVDTDGTFYETPADFLDIEALGLCGCGDLESMRRYIRDKLRQLNQKQWGKYEDLPYMFFVY